MKTIVLIDRKGKEHARLSLMSPDVVLAYDGRFWGLGVAKLNGEHHFYDVTPEAPPMGPLNSGKERAR